VSKNHSLRDGKKDPQHLSIEGRGRLGRLGERGTCKCFVPCSEPPVGEGKTLMRLWARKNRPSQMPPRGKGEFHLLVERAKVTGHKWPCLLTEKKIYGFVYRETRKWNFYSYTRGKGLTESYVPMCCRPIKEKLDLDLGE